MTKDFPTTHAYLAALPGTVQPVAVKGDLADEIGTKVEALLSEERQGAFIGAHQVLAIKEIEARIRSALADVQPVAVAVKGLEWVRRPIIGDEDRIMSYDGYYWLSRVPSGFIVIGEDGLGHVQRLGGDTLIVHPNEEAAKAAAQADYEARIRSALAPATLAVPGDVVERLRNAKGELAEIGIENLWWFTDVLDEAIAALSGQSSLPAGTTEVEP